MREQFIGPHELNGSSQMSSFFFCLLCVLYCHMLLIYRLKLSTQELIRRSRAHCHHFYHVNVKMCSWNDRPVLQAPKLKREAVNVQAELAGE